MIKIEGLNEFVTYTKQGITEVKAHFLYATWLTFESLVKYSRVDTGQLAYNWQPSKGNYYFHPYVMANYDPKNGNRASGIPNNRYGSKGAYLNKLGKLSDTDTIHFLNPTPYAVYVDDGLGIVKPDSGAVLLVKSLDYAEHIFNSSINIKIGKVNPEIKGYIHDI